MIKLKTCEDNKSDGDTIPGHLPQAWQKPRGVPIPDTQFSFGDEEGGGGEVEAILSFKINRFSNLRMMLRRKMMCSWCKIFSRVRYLFCTRTVSTIWKAAISVRLKDIFFFLLDRQCLFSHRGWIYGSLWYVSNVSIFFDCSMLFCYQSSMFYNHFIVILYQFLGFFGVRLDIFIH